jgi:hypothetical protein
MSFENKVEFEHGIYSAFLHGLAFNLPRLAVL